MPCLWQRKFWYHTFDPQSTCCLNSILGSVYEISDLDDYHLSTIFLTWYIRWRLFIFKVVRKYEYKLDFFIIASCMWQPYNQNSFFLMLGVSFTTICIVLSISKTSLNKYRPFDEKYFSYDGIGGLQNLDLFQVNN